MAKRYEIDMTSGSIFKKVFLFAFPLMLSGMLQLLFNAADVIVVGKFAGSLALAAVGSTGSLVNLMINVVIGLSIGTNVMVARFYGSRDHQEMSRCIHCSIFLAAVLGLVSGTAGIFLSKPMLVLMKSDPEVLPLSALYLKIYFLGIPATILYNFGAAILRAIGDTDRPLRYLLISGVINVVLNLILVIVFQLGVSGVAIATVVSQCVAATLVLRCLIKTDSSYHLELKKIRFFGDMTLRIAAIGIPAGLQSTIFSASNIIIQSSINSFGAVAMAGNSAASSIDGFIYIAMNAFYQASLSFTSQNYGARKFDRIKKISRVCMLLAASVGVVLSGLVYGFGVPLLSLYVPASDPNRDAVLAVGMIRLAYVGLPYLLCGAMEASLGSLRGLGRSWTPFIISVLGVCVFRIGWIYTVFTHHQTLETLYISYLISWFVTTLVNNIAFYFVYKKECSNPIHSHETMI